MSGDITRRTAIGVIGGLAGSTVFTRSMAGENQNSTARSNPVTHKIDTHQHYLPKVYIDAIGLQSLAGMMPNHQPPIWSIDGALATMDTNGITEGILSVSAGPRLEDPTSLLRQCNDVGTEIRAKHPGRFGLFASLPIPNVDASLKEIAYSLDALKADGFIIFSNYDGHYLGDPMFAPILDELNRRKAVAFVHPTPPRYELLGQPPSGVLELPFETTRTAVSLIFSGSLKTYPDIKFILSHAGGTLPFLSQRIKGAATMSDPSVGERIGNFDDALRHFWYDTAISCNPPALEALLAVADPSRITFGTDYPFAPPIQAQVNAHGLDQAHMDDKLKQSIGRGNAATLLGRS